ncbi:MAG TPA: putative baseplate assembly protein [Anaerolineales bacterium]|nr:putative baseplate assembly protein [Anaerolineales bacterium]
MTLPIPVLDDRKFQDLVDEAKKRIPHYCKEWTDHNVSDPGVTLIELFAWMTDILLYRLNRVPDLHYVRMMEMLGITLAEPAPARVPITFWLSKPQPVSVTIPAATEVATTQTETQASIVFTTEQDLTIHPPALDAIINRVANPEEAGRKHYAAQNVRRLDAGFEGFEAFSSVPQVDDAIYFGFENDLSDHVVGFDLDCDPAGGAGIDPTLPPLVWEASTGDADERWAECEIETDTTRGLNGAGRITLHVPEMGAARIGKADGYWLRVRVREISEAEKETGMRPYRVSPRIRRARAASWGGRTPAIHARLIVREFVGRSDGSPGQRFSLMRTPVLERGEGETLTVQVEGEPPQTWTEVRDFSGSGSQDRHFTLDGVTGELRFGPAVRQPDGTIKLYSAVPPRGANLVFDRYRTGGGQDGNVERGVVNTLKTAIPFVGRVGNRSPAWGGLDTESLEAAKARVPGLLNAHERAVTEADFEFLARRALPAAIGRVKCLQPRPSEAGRVDPGQVFVLVIPRVPNAEGRIEAAHLEPEEADMAMLRDFLNERRLLTTRLDIRVPAYTWVAARVRLRAAPGADPAAVEREVLGRLYKYLNPLTGGAKGKGWPFGRDLFASDVYQCLQGVPDVQFIRGLEIFLSQADGGPTTDPVETVELLAHGVIASGKHEVEFV